MIYHGDCLEVLPTLEAEYVEIAERRIEHWRKTPIQLEMGEGE